MNLKKEDHEEKLERAKKRVLEIRGFYTHLFVYGAVNLGLFILNMLTSPDSIWYIYPLSGWGIGLVIHGLKNFGLEKRLGKNWEEKQMQKLMQDEEKK